MHVSILSEPGYTGHTIEKPDSELFLLQLSVPYQTERDLATEATVQIYTDVILAGAGQYSRSEFMHALDLLGAGLVVRADTQHLHFTLESTKAKASDVLTLLLTVLEAPHFASKELVRAKSSLKNRRVSLKDNARGEALRYFKRAAFSSTSASFDFTIDELIEVSQTVTSQALRSLHKQVLANRWTVTLGGERSGIRAGIKALNSVKSTPGLAIASLTNKIKVRQRVTPVLTSITSKQNVEFAIGGNLPLLLTDSAYPAFVFGLNVLGRWGGFSGRLMSTVREKEGLTYGIYAETSAVTTDTGGYWRIMTFFAPAVVEQALKSTLREITNIAKSGITGEELAKFKTIISTGYALERDSLLALIKRVHGGTLAGLNYNDQQTLQQRLLAVNQTEVNQALKQYLDLKTLIVSAAGPVQQCKTSLLQVGK